MPVGFEVARALGPHPVVLMNRHGATVVGADLRELVSRSIFLCDNARYQLQAQLLGKVTPLTPGETKLAGSINAMPNVTGRTWEYWCMRLERAGLMPLRGAGRKKSARSRARMRKPGA